MKRLLPLLAILFFTACEKDKDTKPNCDKGTIRFTNTSNNPYNLSINGQGKGQVSGNSFVEYEVGKGEHSCKAEQASGYLLYPTVRETKVSIFGCDEKEFVFP